MNSRSVVKNSEQGYQEYLQKLEELNKEGFVFDDVEFSYAGDRLETFVKDGKTLTVIHSAI